MKRQTVVIMIKEPRPGRVKTRLGQGIGVIPATWWFRHQSARLIRSLRDPRWQIVLAVAPDRAVTSRVWPADLPRLAQGGGDLGQRMKRMLMAASSVAVDRMGRAPVHGPVCLIGADIPGITRAHIARAFAALGHSDAVFGPATDGGYWLVGAKHPARLPQTLFQNVRWSSEHALADSVATLPGWRIAQTDILNDVDTAADLRQSRS
ncbi:TIGR04282 family arsenosugar biosynthesis glycosyltransferase [Phaeobacter gallaeciensis]|uniref:TIGR04282 family arsenosugar biosynthesis glycosyltransferase n=1 Tax=Phaeobacter gallaeciensis TaxID=60890 RepID=UPI00237F995F|nr:TIGR04282 family arsenosugar biosynthesis glycosyltransferase [Phaeobacter gallaeciensis]MDE4193268.1 glycosyltransferase [Phaeobacter gallaeciensis]MDE4198424.1 glycosyltransferase [Phaeobacter gallaeciensis]MDE4202569.1 glycosyltransferase [Phaeobacter gallaeciensis]MDE4206135.1 glycosyltransferase [Phaeobacter gallaeciensis]MDE4214502.1 glycosyltransferase [Phaeobacter gallaeciensis]